jgi:hypothetical protein
MQSKVSNDFNDFFDVSNVLKQQMFKMMGFCLHKDFSFLVKVTYRRINLDTHWNVSTEYAKIRDNTKLRQQMGKKGLPYDSSPFISSPVILSRSFRPLVISYPVISSPVISSPGHLVPWSFRPLLPHHLIQFHMCKIIQFPMCKIILKCGMLSLVTFITTWGLSFHYIQIIFTVTHV